MKSLIILMLTLSMSVAAADVKLAVTLEKGDRFTTIVETKQKIVQSMQGMEQTVDQKIVFDMMSEVLDVEDTGSYVISLTYTRVRFNTQAPMAGMNIDYDSDEPEGEVNQVAKTFAAMVGQTFRYVLSPTNEVVEVRDTEAFIDQLIASQGIPDGPQKDQMRSMLDQQLGGEGLKQMMRSATVPFPSDKVSVGRTWTSEASLSAGPIATDYTNTFEVASIEGDAVRINSSSVVEPSEKTIENMGMEMIAKLGGTQNGFMMIDKATGITTNGEIRQNFEGTLSMMGMEIPMKIDSEVTITGKIL